MFDRHEGGERTLIVQVDIGKVDDRAERLEEIRLLAESAGGTVEVVITGRRAAPDSSTFAGKGKVEEIAQAVRAFNVDVVIFNHDLSPGQQRNLEKALQCRVIDRTALILDIFALRAQSAEGKAQVELAQLEHMATRLVRGWTHLERQRGGIGMRGPGEKQLETDRRLLGDRIKALKIRLAQLDRQRATQRKQRQKGNQLNVSIVGYTNAGKSTVFNALTRAGAYAANQLFATLDTTSRRLFLPEVGHVILSDTVGFIRDLPHGLVAAFHSTLETAVEADLLLHVVDSASPARDRQIEAVHGVLKEIGADSVPQAIVLNKLDLTGLPAGMERDAYGRIVVLRVSAKSSEGIELLRMALAEYAQDKHFRLRHADLLEPATEFSYTTESDSELNS